MIFFSLESCRMSDVRCFGYVFLNARRICGQRLLSILVYRSGMFCMFRVERFTKSLFKGFGSLLGWLDSGRVVGGRDVGILGEEAVVG